MHEVHALQCNHTAAALRVALSQADGPHMPVCPAADSVVGLCNAPCVQE